MPVPVPTLTPAEHRSAVRFDTVLAMAIDGSTARTRNISSGGVNFETGADLRLGSLVNLNLEFTQGGAAHWIACEGKVVRVAHADGRNVIAARLLTPFFSPLEEPLTAASAKR